MKPETPARASMKIFEMLYALYGASIVKQKERIILGVAGPRRRQSANRTRSSPRLARTLGYAAAIEEILTDIRTREDLPWSLLNIVGEESMVAESAAEGTYLRNFAGS